VNQPVSEDGVHYQFVMNTITKSWCKFTGWDAEDFVEYNNDLYFCDGTSVNKAWTGTSDGGTNIVAFGKTAFSYFSRPGLMKRFTGYRPVLATNGTLSFLTDMDVDFQDLPISGTATYTPYSAGVWGTGLWGTALWGATMTVLKEWTSPGTYPGYAAAAKIKVTTTTVAVQWMANDYTFEYGGAYG
jgi:hypothetical protein